MTVTSTAGGQALPGTGTEGQAAPAGTQTPQVGTTQPATGQPAPQGTPQAGTTPAAGQPTPQAGGTAPAPTTTAPQTVTGPDGQPLDVDRMFKLVENLRNEKKALADENSRLKQTPAPAAQGQQPVAQGVQPTQQAIPTGPDPMAAIEQLRKDMAERDLKDKFREQVVEAGLPITAVDSLYPGARSQFALTDGGQVTNLTEVIAGLKSTMAPMFTGQAGTAPAGGTQPNPNLTNNVNGGVGAQGGTQPGGPPLSADEKVFAEAFGMTDEQWVARKDANYDPRSRDTEAAKAAQGKTAAQ